MQWTDSDAGERDTLKMSACVFDGTLVPVSALFENLGAGATIDQFVDWLPRVTRERALAVLQHAARSLLAAP